MRALLNGQSQPPPDQIAQSEITFFFQGGELLFSAGPFSSRRFFRILFHSGPSSEYPTPRGPGAVLPRACFRSPLRGRRPTVCAPLNRSHATATAALQTISRRRFGS